MMRYTKDEEITEIPKRFKEDGFVPWDGDYEKQHYVVLTKSLVTFIVWPNAGEMGDIDRKKILGVKPISTEDYLAGKYDHYEYEFLG